MEINAYLIRHGETYFNKYEKIQGWCNTPLTDNGINSMYSLREILGEITFNKVITSDLPRTIESAKIIMKDNPKFEGVDLISIKELRETFFGSFEGENNDIAWNQVLYKSNCTSMEEMVKKFELGEVLNLFKKADPYGDAENKEEFYKRMDRAIQEIIENSCDGDNILFISHGNFIRHFLYRYTGKIYTNINNGSCIKCSFEIENLKNMEVTKYA